MVDKNKIIDVGHEPLTGFQGDNVDLSGCIAIPGFVDTHIHGIEGVDATADPSAETYLEMSYRLVKYGVTSFVPTTVTAPYDLLKKACKSVREAIGNWRPSVGARILGLHLEGPFVNEEMAGAQNPMFIREPNIRELRDYIEASGNNILQITLAPELKNALDLIAYAKVNGIVVSAGHTNATYEEGSVAVEAGVTKATHLFNGMRKIHHRDPGIAFALIEDPRVYLELIVDYIHVHPVIVKHIIKYAGSDRVVLITDAISAAGLSDGIYELGGLKIRVNKGIAKLIDKDSLAGSTLTMIKALKNAMKLGFNMADVSKMTSYTPLKSINLLCKLNTGKIDRGYKADIVILNENYDIDKVYIEGELQYEKSS